MLRSTPLHREVFKSGSKTYFNSSLFFPPEVRDDVYILYGFVRTADNFVDNVPQLSQEFQRFTQLYRGSRDGTDSKDLIIESFVDLERRKGFEPEWTDAFLKSMEMDLSKSEYQTVDETLEYVYGSAEVIGLYMNRIMGIPKEGDEAACMLGRSMQFINFIRDIAEDHGLGRCYLPLEEWGHRDLGSQTAQGHPEDFVAFVEKQLSRYLEWQIAAEGGYHHLPRRYRIPIKTAADMYKWTADTIRRDPFVVYRRKVKPSKGRVFRGVLHNWLTVHD